MWLCWVVPPELSAHGELADYYHAIAEQVDAPLGLYECPVPRAFHLPDDLVGELADSGRFVAFKETSCDLGRIRKLIARTRDTALSVLQANNSYLLASVQAGGLGSMSIAAVHLPDLLRDIIAKGRAGDPDAERLQRLLSAIHLAQPLLLIRKGLSIYWPSAGYRSQRVAVRAKRSCALRSASRSTKPPRSGSTPRGRCAGYSGRASRSTRPESPARRLGDAQPQPVDNPGGNRG